MIFHLIEPYIGRGSSNNVSLAVIGVILEYNGRCTSERDTRRSKKEAEKARDDRYMANADIIVFFVTNANIEARNRVLAMIGTKPIIWLYEKGKSQELAHAIVKDNANIFVGSYKTISELTSVMRKLLSYTIT